MPPLTPGESFSICINCESAEEQDRCFAALGGTVEMPVQQMF